MHKTNLHQFPLFAPLSDETFTLLKNKVIMRHYHTAELVILEGMHARQLTSSLVGQCRYSARLRTGVNRFWQH